MKEKSATELRIQVREEKIIKCALEIIDESGFASLRMETLHKRAECTKGTLYNHFINREDLLCEIATRYSISIMAYFKRMESFRGNTREQIMALFLAYQTFCFSNPALFASVLQLQNQSLMERGSEKRLNNYRKEEMRVILHMTHIIQHALDEGHIGAQYQGKVFELAFTGWATAFGNISLMMSSQGAFLTQQADKEQQLFLATNFSLDGLGWLPLSTEFDYQKTWGDVGERYFKEELEELRQK